MKSVQSVKDFKQFLNINREKVFAHVIEAGKLPINDEWMQEDQWDEIYEQEMKKNGEV